VGLESRSSVGIYRILAELPHSTKLELGKLYRAREDSGRASVLELLWELLTSREVLRPSKPHLSLYSTRTKLGSTLEDKLTLSSRFLPRELGGIYRGVKSVLWAKVGLGGPTCQVGQPSRVVGRSWSHRLSHLGSFSYRLNVTCVESIISLAPNPGRLAKEWAWLAPH
jgi:hypothetical protein